MRETGSAPSQSAGGLRLLNVSQIYEFSRCRYRFNLGTMLRIQPRAVMRAPDLGSAVHAGMEAVFRELADASRFGVPFSRENAAVHSGAAIQQYIRSQIDLRGGIEKTPVEEVAALHEIETEAIRVLERQVRIFEVDRWEVVLHPETGEPLIEAAVQVPMDLDPWEGFHATIDIVLRDRRNSGIVLVADYKVRKAFTPPDSEEVNFQQIVYQHVLRQIGVETDGTMMWQIKSSAPAVPKLNKNGTMSRSRVATDWATYRDELIRNGLDPEDYRGEMEPKLDVQFERQDIVVRSPEVASRTWEEIVLPAAREIGALYTGEVPGPEMYRHMGPYNCKGCWARDYCNAELHGEDPNHLLTTQYIDFKSERTDAMYAPFILSPNDVDFTED